MRVLQTLMPTALVIILFGGRFLGCSAFHPFGLSTGTQHVPSQCHRASVCEPLFMVRRTKDEDEESAEHFGFGESLLRQLRVPSGNDNDAKGKTSTDATKTAEQQPAPLYITIGPPCAGKTSALRLQLEEDGYDPDAVLMNSKQKKSKSQSATEVALDEQANVYQRIPLAGFLFPATRLDPQLADTVLDSSGTTVRERLLNPSSPRLESTDAEIRNIILRVAGRVTPQEFADRTREQALQARDTVKFFRDRRMEIAEDLILAVERISVQAVGEILFQMQMQQVDPLEAGAASSSLTTTDDVAVNELPYHDKDETTMSSSKSSLPDNVTATMNATSAQLLSARALIRTPYVELFVPQAIFSSGGGIDSAELQLQQLLNNLPLTTPVSWGNTNSKPIEYAAALRAAQRAGRPVKFVAWGISPFLPCVPREELLRRTVSKFRNTGRYIPAGAVGAALGRVEWLIKEAIKEADKLSASSDDALLGELADMSDEDHNSREIQHRINVALAALAGFAMDDDGRVVRIGKPRTPNQRFHSKKGKNRKKRVTT